MDNDLRHARPRPDFRLAVEVADGRTGIVDMAPFLAHPGLEALRDPGYLARVTVVLGAATWPDGEDVAPDTMAAAMRTGLPA